MPKTKTARNPEAFAYVRVSQKEQKTDRQLIALESLQIPDKNLFIDRISGKNFNRPKYKSLFRVLRPGDLLYIKSIDRLGRNYAEIIEQWRLLTQKKGVDIKVLDMPMLDTTYHKDLLGTFIADLVLQILSYTAQTERENILQRQAEGIAAAKAKGVVFGRKNVNVPDDFPLICQKWRNNEITGVQAAKLCGFSLKTLYNLTADLRAGE